MASSPNISIYVQPPLEDQCAPLDFGDVVVDPPFDSARHSHYLSGPTYDLVETYPSHSYGKDTNDNRVVRQDRPDFSDYYRIPLGDNHPFPYGSLSYNTPRSPVDIYSPYTSTMGDEFSPNTSPSIHGGALSPSSSGEPLSPTLLANLSLPFTEMNLDCQIRPTMFRYRSQSVSEGTVAPADTWRDPAAHLVFRSAPSMTAPLPDAVLADYTLLCDVSAEYGFTGGIISENDGGVPTPDEQRSLDVYMSPDTEETGYQSNGLLFRPAYVSPRPTIDIGIDSTFNPTHRRGYSDSSGFLSPTSPNDRHIAGIHQRRMSNAGGSVRHAPYPASAPSTPEGLGSFNLPELASGHLHRRHSGPSSSRPKLSIDVQSSGNSQALASQQYVYSLSNTEDPIATPVKSEWSQPSGFGQLSPSIQFAHGMTDQLSTCVGDQRSPGSAMSTSSSSWKKVVGSAKIVNASNARRKRESKFICALPECGQTFTAKHNLTYHMLSHSGERRFSCDKCHDRFTTPGVASRHRAKCTGSGGSTKRRRSASSVASTSRLPLES